MPIFKYKYDMKYESVSPLVNKNYAKIPSRKSVEEKKKFSLNALMRTDFSTLFHINNITVHQLHA